MTTRRVTGWKSRRALLSQTRAATIKARTVPFQLRAATVPPTRPETQNRLCGMVKFPLRRAPDGTFWTNTAPRLTNAAARQVEYLHARKGNNSPLARLPELFRVPGGSPGSRAHLGRGHFLSGSPTLTAAPGSAHPRPKTQLSRDFGRIVKSLCDQLLRAPSIDAVARGRVVERIPMSGQMRARMLVQRRSRPATVTIVDVHPHAYLGKVQGCSSWLSTGKAGFSSASGHRPTFILESK